MLRFVCSVAMRRVRRALCVPHPQSWSVFGGVWLSIAAIMLMLPLPLCGVSLPLLTHPVVANSPKFNSLCLTAPFKLVVPASSPGRSLAGIGAARDNSFFVDSVPLLGGLSSAFVTGAASPQHNKRTSRSPNINGRLTAANRALRSIRHTRDCGPALRGAIATSPAPVNPAQAALKTTGAEAPRIVPRVGGPMPAQRPDWFHVPAPKGKDSQYQQLKDGIKNLKLHTVCEEAQCPNIGECWNSGTATLMVLGDVCTRGCRFCAIKTSNKPPPADPDEPLNVAAAVSQWQGLKYVVLTSVDRDDMVDGGANHFATTVEYIKAANPDLLVECLVSDFQGDEKAVRTLANCGLDVYSHNTETVERLQRHVRDRRAGYQQSLSVLRLAKEINPKLYTKTSLMLGLGETKEEVIHAMKDMRAHNIDILTLGIVKVP
eukprot:GHVT01102414.1.p1 GENE.GHVT01102414.1~~GHVT01102414.1.p1  ORF type:complete len:431 (+),score=30.13 GHVT01102414.1:489-1781(+)